MLVKEIERTVDGVMIGEGHEAHAPLFRDLVDILGGVVAVSCIGAAEVLENRKTAVAMQIRAFQRRIRHDYRRIEPAHWFRMIVQPISIFYNSHADVVERGHT